MIQEKNYKTWMHTFYDIIISNLITGNESLKKKEISLISPVYSISPLNGNMWDELLI